MALLIGFSGQGMQHDNMFDILKTNEIGQVWLTEASNVININLFDTKMVGKFCYDVLYAQLFITFLSVGVFKVLQKKLLSFNPLLCGYSLGEISAFCAGSNLSLDNISKIIENRVKFMQEASTTPAGLVALKGRINLNAVKELALNFNCYLAIINAEDHFIVGGLNENLDLLQTAAQSMGVMRVQKLAIKLASHTPLLKSASDSFLQYLKKQFNNTKMQYTILNTLTSEKITSTEETLPILARELSETLRWDRLMKIAHEYNIKLFLELGPGSALKNMYLNSRSYALDDFLTIDGCIKILENL